MEINSILDLIKLVESYGDSAVTNIIFRGVSSSSHKLIPKVGRLKHFRRSNLSDSDEKDILENFKLQAQSLISYTPKNDWEWLAIGQHHGLPTRLLDWSRNPLIACWFAVENDYNDDSIIYVLKNPNWLNIKEFINPFEVNKVLAVSPTHVTKRITAQSGIFTIHPYPTEEFMSKEIDKIIIPNNVRRKIKKDLYKLGISASSVFPDLDGLSKMITWIKTNEH